MARSALRATLCLAAVVVGAGSKAEMTTYNMIRPDRGYKNKGGDQNYKGLPRLIFNKLKLDFGKVSLCAHARRPSTRAPGRAGGTRRSSPRSPRRVT